MARVSLAAQRGGAPGAGREAGPFPAPGGVLGKQWAVFWQREEVRVTLALTHWAPEPALLGLLWAQPGGSGETPHPKDFGADLLAKSLPLPLHR